MNQEMITDSPQPKGTPTLKALLKWVLVFVISLVVLGSSYYLSSQWQHLFTEQRSLQTTQRFEQNELAQLKQQYQDLSQQLQAMSQNQESVQTTLQKEVKPQLEALQNRVPARDQTMWLLSEANYLVQLAYQKLYVMRDIENTIKLLELADQKVQATKDSQYLPLREALKYDVTKLKAIHLPDLAGIWFTIATLLEDAQHLPVLRPGRSFADNSANQLENRTALNEEGWRGAFKQSLYSLKEIVRIRHHDRVVDTKLFVMDPGFVIERLRLLLEQIRWAALNENPDIYSKGILQAKEWLNRHFDATDVNVQSIVETLSSLDALDIKPTLPEVLSSVRAFNEAVKRL